MCWTWTSVSGLVGYAACFFLVFDCRIFNELSGGSLIGFLPLYIVPINYFVDNFPFTD